MIRIYQRLESPRIAVVCDQLCVGGMGICGKFSLMLVLKLAAPDKPLCTCCPLFTVCHIYKTVHVQKSKKGKATRMERQ